MKYINRRNNFNYKEKINEVSNIIEENKDNSTLLGSKRTISHSS